MNYALKEIDANLYKWQIPTEEKWISDNFGTTYYPKGNLVIILDKYNTGAYKLAWKFDIYAHKPVSRNYIFVDAISGIIIKKTSRLHNSNANGTASTRYSGSRSIVTDSYAGGFRLKETRNSVRIETYNMHQDTVFGSASLFQDDNNNWTAAEYHNANKDDAALDAHWGTEKVYDYFYIVHNRNSYNGSGGPLLSFVHVNIEAYPFFYDNNNAYWDGQRMIYADGDGVNYDPFTTLDISAHELAHGICDFTARFDYENESGAINEGFSDIWAACVERYAAPEKQTWLIGEDNAIPPNGHPGRSMSNPNTYNQPDTYGGTYWVQTGCSPFPAPSNDFCGVHTNSGVLNFWFFLLSEGGSGTNDLNHSYNVWPIGINKASRIAYRAETVIIPPPTYPGESSTTFNQLRTATISAATDLYGANSCEVRSVTNAWYAVGIGTSFADNMSVSGPSLVCSNGTFTLNNPLKLGNSYSHITWSVSPSYLVSPSSGSGGTTASLSKASNGNPLITFNPGCGVTNVSKLFHTGPYSSSDYPITGPGSAGCNSYVYYNIPTLSGVTSINWTWPMGWTYVSGQGTTYLALRTCTSGGIVAVGVNNTCGQSGSYATKYTSVYGCFSLIVIPNPASDLVNITISEPQSIISDTSATMNSVSNPSEESIVYNITITDDMGVVHYRTNKYSNSFTINVQALKNGNYIITADDGVNKFTSQLVIKH